MPINPLNTLDEWDLLYEFNKEVLIANNFLSFVYNISQLRK